VQRVAVCCSVLQCVAVCCSVTIHSFVYSETYSYIQWDSKSALGGLMECSVLRCVAVCCSVLQCCNAFIRIYRGTYSYIQLDS